jgi:hypothetical protein
MPSFRREAERNFGPLEQFAEYGPLATELDRILVTRFENGRTAEIWFRLIGPGFSLNLELGIPTPGFREADIKFSTDNTPERHRDIIEIDVKTCSYFADLYFFIRQHGLHRWDFSRHHSGEWITGCLSWA